jgi:hypothetical protein
MSWHFEGRGSNMYISLGSEGEGAWRAYGTAFRQWCRPSAGDFGFLSAIGNVKDIYWNVFPPGWPEASVDGMGRGLAKRFATTSRSMAMVEYAPPDNTGGAYVSVTAILESS